MARAGAMVGVVAAFAAATCVAEDASSPLAPEPGPAGAEVEASTVVINEIMVNTTAVIDDDGEWLELRNRGLQPVDLRGWTIHSDRNDPHVIAESVVIEPGGYVVLARVGDPSRNGGVEVDYVFGEDVKVSNPADAVWLRDASGVTVDSVRWTDAVPEGASRGVVDVSAGNADFLGSNWVTQSSRYGGGDRGTPGAPNDGAAPPASSAIVISEIMVDPTKVIDDEGEWFEVRNIGSEPVDLEGWSIHSDRNAPHVISESLVVEPGGFAVLARVGDPSRNGGVDVDYVFGGDVKVSNRGDALELRDANGALVDSVRWTDDAPAGASRGVLIAGLDHSDFLGDNWVTQSTTYGRGDRGTPGGPNDLSSPPPSDARIVIHEVMVDPTRVRDDDGEWFEVHNLGSEPVDLEGWTIHSARNAGHTISRSLVVEPGGFAVLGRLADRSRNGDVDVDYAYGTGVKLSNNGDGIALRDASGGLVDSVHWASPAPVGASRGMINVLAEHTDVNGANWATSTSPYGAGDLGTPGAPNDPPSSGDRELVVRVLDIGHGDATYIENGGSRVFIDGGPDPARLAEHLDALGIRNTTVDIVIISHLHAMHYSGLRELFNTERNITIGYVIENRDGGGHPELAELRDSIEAREARRELLYRDADDPCGNGASVCTMTLRGGAKLHILRPDPDGASVNNRSVAVKLVGPDSASFTMWLAGDAEHPENAWFDTGAGYDGRPGMNVDVIKANHHGNCDAISERYLDLTRPSWVVIPVGAENASGLVPTQTKELLRSRSIPWYRNDMNGTITIRSPGTPGGGYTIAAESGFPSMDGATDRTSSEPACSDLSGDGLSAGIVADGAGDVDAHAVVSRPGGAGSVR